MLDVLSTSFVPLLVDTTTGVPSGIPGLATWSREFAIKGFHRYGFATAAVVSADGSEPLGTSGCGHRWELETSMNFDPARFSAMLHDCLGRAERLRDATPAALAALRAEVRAQIVSVNQCPWGIRLG